MKVTVLAGGVGGARFTRGLRHLLTQRLPDGDGGTTAQITVVVNTGDDLWLHGVRVCPDLDTVMYTLGGGVHEGQGWGRRDESSRVSADLAVYDLGWKWFTLGDLDLATHLARTELLRAGLPLSQVTDQLCRRWQPGVRILPMSDQEVETHVVVDDGPGGERQMHFEEWWVRYRAAVPAVRFELVGIADAVPAPGVLEAITKADVVVLPPSNPVVSIGTILAIPGVRAALASTLAPVVGVSPIIGGASVRGMADACLRTIEVETSAAAVARHYGARVSGGLLDGWLMDSADAGAVDALVADGFRAGAVDTLMVDVPTTGRIAADALGLVGL